MAQRYCPICRVPVGLPNTEDKVFGAILTQHRGSKRCAAHEAMMGSAQTGAQDDRLPYVVRFESPKRMLRIRIQPPTKGIDRNGRPVTTVPAQYVQFADGTLNTSSKFEVARLRGARNNAGVIIGLGGAPHKFNDQFFEVGCFDPATKEKIDPKEYAEVAFEGMQRAQKKAEEAAASPAG